MYFNMICMLIASCQGRWMDVAKNEITLDRLMNKYIYMDRLDSNLYKHHVHHVQNHDANILPGNGNFRLC